MLICLAIAVFFATIAAADARTRRRQRPSAFKVALQPFSLARSVVHAVADPIVEPLIHHAPRVLTATAIAPVRIAQRSARAVPVDDGFDEFAEEECNEQHIPTARAVRLPERENYAKAVRVAYVVPRDERAPAPPRAEPADEEASGEAPPSRYAEPEEQFQAPELSGGAKPMVSGSRAVLRNGVAYAPSHAPQAVKNAIWAANSLRRKPYIWGGGHGSFYDRGYDCSGTVSFALNGAGVLKAPLPSSELTRFGERGRGRWFTIYSRPGHTFAVIAGLRLDTTDFQNGGNTGPRWHADMRDTSGYVARHPAGM